MGGFQGSSHRDYDGAQCSVGALLHSGSPLSSTRSREAGTTRALLPMSITRQGNSS